MLQLREFLDENAHRSYPFKGPNSLPTELILDLHLLISGVTQTLDYKENLVINKVIVSTGYISLSFAYKTDTTLTNIGSATIPINDAEKTQSFSVTNNSILIDGSITLGYCDSSFIGTYNLDNSGLIFEGCVIPVTQWCTGLLINNKLHTGIVTIEVSDGVVLTPQYNEGSTTLAFSIRDYSNISSDDIDKEIASQIGNIIDTQSFVKTINGVKPDTEGNISLVIGEPMSANIPELPNSFYEAILDDSFVNTLTIENSENAAIYLRDVQTPFCYDKSYFSITDSAINALRNNATELSTRVQSIENHLDALENNLNTVNMQLAKMD